MIEICTCGYPKKNHIVLEELECVKNLKAAEEIIRNVMTRYAEELTTYGNIPCLIYRPDNLRSLEAEASRRGDKNGR